MLCWISIATNPALKLSHSNQNKLIQHAKLVVKSTPQKSLGRVRLALPLSAQSLKKLATEGHSMRNTEVVSSLPNERLQPAASDTSETHCRTKCKIETYLFNVCTSRLVSG
jgi:hypothetical protein